MLNIGEDQRLCGAFSSCKGCHRFDDGAGVLRFTTSRAFSRIVQSVPSRRSQEGDRTSPVFGAEPGRIDRRKGSWIWRLCCRDPGLPQPRKRRASDGIRDGESGGKIFKKLPLCAILCHSLVTPLSRLGWDLVLHRRLSLRERRRKHGIPLSKTRICRDPSSGYPRTTQSEPSPKPAICRQLVRLLQWPVFSGLPCNRVRRRCTLTSPGVTR